MSLEEHLRAFWRSLAENLYTFVWWGIFGVILTAIAWIASSLFGFVIHVEAYLIGASIALVFALSGTVFSIWRRRWKIIGTGSKPEEVPPMHDHVRVVSSPASPAERVAPMGDSIAVKDQITVAKALPAKPQNLVSPATLAVSAAYTLSKGTEYYAAFDTSRPKIELSEDNWIELGTLYRFQNGILVLRFLPDTEETKEENALLLLLYGYRQIYNRLKVEAWVLEHGLYVSNCRKRLPLQTTMQLLQETIYGTVRDDQIKIDSLAKSWYLSGKISEKFGLAKGGFYSITDKGLAEAEALFADLVRRA